MKHAEGAEPPSISTCEEKTEQAQQNKICLATGANLGGDTIKVHQFAQHDDKTVLRTWTWTKKNLVF